MIKPETDFDECECIYKMSEGKVLLQTVLLTDGCYQGEGGTKRMCRKHVHNACVSIFSIAEEKLIHIAYPAMQL